MTSKYSLKEKEDILNEHFTEDNIIVKPIDNMERLNSRVDDDVIENRKLIFEILKMEGDDAIRFAIARSGNCTCNSFVCDSDDLINLRDLLLSAYPVEEVSLKN